jgi:uncharacterized protein YwqG
MGLFDFFKKKINTETNTDASADLLKRVQVKEGIETIKLLADNWPAIEGTKLNYISIQATPIEPMKIEQSKFGGYPKIPAGFEYPKDSTGNFMYPLAQINFKEVPTLPGYPNTGFLQFYISVNDCFGLSFESSNQIQKDFRVLFFEEDAVQNHCTDFSFLEEVMKTDNTPIFKPHSLSFTRAEEYLGSGDVRFEKNSGDLMQSLQKQYPAIDDEIGEAFYDDFASSGHKIGGYAYFTQDDPRNYDKILSTYILLLQIDTDEEIMWGDCGVGNFFYSSR